MKTFAHGTHCDEEILGRVDVAVVWSVPPYVSSAIDEPRRVEGEDVAQKGTHEQSVPQVLPPEVPRHDSRNHEAHQYHGRPVHPGNKREQSVIFQLQGVAYTKENPVYWHMRS